MNFDLNYGTHLPALVSLVRRGMRCVEHGGGLYSSLIFKMCKCAYIQIESDPKFIFSKEVYASVDDVPLVHGDLLLVDGPAGTRQHCVDRLAPLHRIVVVHDWETREVKKVDKTHQIILRGFGPETAVFSNFRLDNSIFEEFYD